METTRVVILSNRSILSYIVEHLLASAQEIDLRVIALDEPDWQDNLLATAPDTILIDSGNGGEGWDFVRNMLNQHPNANLVSLDLQQPIINVYSMNRIQQSDVHGLLHAIQRCNPPESTYEADAHRE